MTEGENLFQTGAFKNKNFIRGFFLIKKNIFVFGNFQNIYSSTSRSVMEASVALKILKIRPRKVAKKLGYHTLQYSEVPYFMISIGKWGSWEVQKW